MAVRLAPLARGASLGRRAGSRLDVEEAVVTLEPIPCAKHSSRHPMHVGRALQGHLPALRQGSAHSTDLPEPRAWRWRLETHYYAGKAPHYYCASLARTRPAAPAALRHGGPGPCKRNAPPRPAGRAPRRPARRQQVCGWPPCTPLPGCSLPSGSHQAIAPLPQASVPSAGRASVAAAAAAPTHTGPRSEPRGPHHRAAGAVCQPAPGALWPARQRSVWGAAVRAARPAGGHHRPRPGAALFGGSLPG